MRTSIRTRMIVAMNLLVVAVGVAVGWGGIEVAGRVIERRLVDEAVANAAGLAGEMGLPLSDSLMARLGKILGANVAAGPAQGDTPSGAKPPPNALTGARQTAVTASNLPPELARQFAAALADPATGATRRLTLDGAEYRLGIALVSQRETVGPPRPNMRLYLLVPESQISAAKGEAARTIALLTGAAIVLATGLAFWISTTITRPVRLLAERMDRLAGAEEDAGTRGRGDEGTRELKGESGATPKLAVVDELGGAGPKHPQMKRLFGGGTRGTAGPTELVRLGNSFEQLLGRLEAARGQLARSARLATLGQLAASVAHELRNPLSGIKMNARVLADELARAGLADRSLDLIVREIDRMDLYLSELLDFSGGGPAGPTAALEGPASSGPPATAKRGPPAAEPVRLDALAESVIALLAGRCRHAGVEVQRQFDPATPAARGDATQLRQVMLNLMLNALDAMPHGGKLTLAIGPRSAAAGGPGMPPSPRPSPAKGEGKITAGGGCATEQPLVRFAVRDTGGGVAVPDGADIFEPFVTSKADGTGLGLAICRQVIARHGGQIGYDSSPSGSTFWFELPAAPSETTSLSP